MRVDGFAAAFLKDGVSTSMSADSFRTPVSKIMDTNVDCDAFVV